jgi:hypothetical protein
VDLQESKHRPDKAHSLMCMDQPYPYTGQHTLHHVQHSEAHAAAKQPQTLQRCYLSVLHVLQFAVSQGTPMPCCLICKESHLTSPTVLASALTADSCASRARLAMYTCTSQIAGQAYLRQTAVVVSCKHAGELGSHGWVTSDETHCFSRCRQRPSGE